jgi:hypothetical protein
MPGQLVKKLSGLWRQAHDFLTPGLPLAGDWVMRFCVVLESISRDSRDGRVNCKLVGLEEMDAAGRR